MGGSNIQKSSYISGGSNHNDSNVDQVLEGMAKLVERPSNEIGNSGISLNRA